MAENRNGGMHRAVAGCFEFGGGDRICLLFLADHILAAFLSAPRHPAAGAASLEGRPVGAANLGVLSALRCLGSLHLVANGVGSLGSASLRIVGGSRPVHRGIPAWLYADRVSYVVGSEFSCADPLRTLWRRDRSFTQCECASPVLDANEHLSRPYCAWLCDRFRHA